MSDINHQLPMLWKGEAVETLHPDVLLEIVRQLHRELEASRSTGLIYRIRKALGFNELYPLSHLDGDVRQQRSALLACAPLAFAAIAEEKKDEIGNSDLDNEQPVTFMIRTTLGVVREARRALFVAGLSAQVTGQTIDKAHQS